MDIQASGPLVIRLCNWVGEVVLSIPSFKRLALAGYELHLFGKSWAPQLLEGTGWPVRVRPAGFAAAIRSLRELRAELGVSAPRALLMTKSLSSALEARCAGLRPAGYAYDGRSLLLNAAYPLPKFKHASHTYWHLAGCLLRTPARAGVPVGPEVPYPTEVNFLPSASQQTRALALLQSVGLKVGQFALFCPFSGADDREHRKVWPGFAALAKGLAAHGVPVAICPGPGEEAIARVTLPQALPLNDIDLGVYAALLKFARVVVANDTGPGHLAAAVGANLVSIYGPYSVAFWQPLGSKVHLLGDLNTWPTVEQVTAAALEVR